MVEDIIFLLIILIGLSIIAYWGFYLIKEKKMKFSLNYIETGDQYYVFHIFTELLTALICIISGILFFLDNPIGRNLGLVSSGMLLYAGINTLGWSIRNKKSLNFSLVLTTIISVVFIFLLI